MAACLSLVFVASAFAWIATHPAHASQDRILAEESAEPASGSAPELAPVRPIVSLARLPEGSSQEGPVAAAPVEPGPTAIALAPAPAALPAKAPAGERRAHHPPQNYGTQVQFLSSPEEAAEQASQEKKLLFVLHVSGNFEDSCFT
jgi:hypothetical protein